MTAKHDPKHAPPDGQLAKFKEAARRLGCDEDEAAFDEKLRRIGKGKPQPPKERKDDKKGGS